MVKKDAVTTACLRLYEVLKDEFLAYDSAFKGMTQDEVRKHIDRYKWLLKTICQLETLMMEAEIQYGKGSSKS